MSTCPVYAVQWLVFDDKIVFIFSFSTNDKYSLIANSSVARD